MSAEDRITQAIAENGTETYYACSFVVAYAVLPCIDSASVNAVLRLLAEHPALNLAFWSEINRAPTTDEGWASFFFLGRYKSVTEHRVVVETVRQAASPAFLARMNLFRQRDET